MIKGKKNLSFTQSNCRLKKNSVVSDLKECENQKLSAKKIFVLSLCGAIIGLVNGLFGGGGGMICVPLLEKVLHLSGKYSHATAIVIILPISYISAVIYCLSGNLDMVSFLTVGSGVLLGGIVGSFTLKFLPEKILKLIFVVIMFAGGIRLIF